MSLAKAFTAERRGCSGMLGFGCGLSRSERQESNQASPEQACADTVFQVSGVAWEVQREWASVPASPEDQPIQNLPSRMVVLLQRE